MENPGLELDEFQSNHKTNNNIETISNEQHHFNIDILNKGDRTTLEQDTHIIPLDDLFKRFRTDPQHGLLPSLVAEAQVQYGANTMTPPKQPSIFSLLFKELFMGFNIILWIAGVFAFLAYKPFGEPNPLIANLALGVILFLVIVCNSFMNVYQEKKSMKIVSSFSKLMPVIVTVRRDGREQSIAAEQLVPGDIILLRTGESIPADCRFFICHELKINAAEVTGNSDIITATINPTSMDFAESTNVGLYSSTIDEGTGEAVVIAIGDNTVFGKMSQMKNDSAGSSITGLHREVNRFVLIVFVATVISIIVLWITWGAWLTRSHHAFLSYNGNIVNSIGMIVAFLPLGLPSIVTVALTIVAKRMYKQHMLVKSLQIVETFSSISVVVTDKTGVLTQKKMEVAHLLWDKDGLYTPTVAEQPRRETIFQAIRRLSSDVSMTARRLSAGVTSFARSLSSGSLSHIESARSSIDKSQLEDDLPISNTVSKVARDVQVQVFRDLLLGAVFCSNAELKRIEATQSDQNATDLKNDLSLVGDNVDTALYSLCADRCFVDIAAVRERNPRLKVLPFSSSNKVMITANQLESRDPSVPEGNRTVLIVMKGALQTVIKCCSTYKTNNDKVLPLDDEVKQNIFNRQVEFQQNGYDVIAMCQQSFTRQEYDSIIENHREGHPVGKDLAGFPSNNYCFTGLFTLFDPPRSDVPDSVLKARCAQIRVAMIAEDESATAKATAKQVHIFTPEITDMNGIDTLKVVKNEAGQVIFSLFRNDKKIKEHVPERLTRIILENTPDENSKQQRKSNTKEISHEQDLAWYKRAWISCRNQFAEPKSELPPVIKKDYIPYAVMIEGKDTECMDDFMWDWVLSHQELIFAKTSSEQKLQIVKELQRRGETVAVTGDRTKDATTLKVAHLGIALRSSTEATREASDAILLNNNFTFIIQSIEAGRLLSENLKKVAIYLLPGGSWAQIWPVFFNLWFGMPLALSAIWCTIFCMFNDLFMSLAMVTEKPERNIMSKPPPDRRKDHVLNLKLLAHAYIFIGNLQCFTAFFCFCYYWIDNGVPFYSFMFTYQNFGIKPAVPHTSEELLLMTNVAQSVYYCSMCLFQFFNFMATRTRYTSILKHNPIYGDGQNLYVFGAMVISAAIQLFFTKIVWLNKILGTGQVPVKYVMPTLGFGMLLLIIDELRKYYVRKRPHSFIARISW